jgi:hypothetical protein
VDYKTKDWIEDVMGGVDACEALFHKLSDQKVVESLAHIIEVVRGSTFHSRWEPAGCVSAQCVVDSGGRGVYSQAPQESLGAIELFMRRLLVLAWNRFMTANHHHVVCRGTCSGAVCGRLQGMEAP